MKSGIKMNLAQRKLYSFSKRISSRHSDFAYEKKIYEISNKQLEMIMKRLDYIEFRQELVFSNSNLDRSIFEYELTR